MSATDDRGFILKLKLLLPERVWRMMTRPAAWGLAQLPDGWKYRLGLGKRRTRQPYSVIEPGDVVFQIGCPQDLLRVGRSRAGYFLMLVSGGGKLVVMEPDRSNCDAFRAFARKVGKSDDVIVIDAGGWSETKELVFYESRSHPASAVMAELSGATSEEMSRRGYRAVTVPVTTVDAVIAEHGLPRPKLVSITTNGAEEQILAGMSETLSGDGVPYIALAIADDAYRELMPSHGYAHVAEDDRGHTFAKVTSGSGAP